MKNIRCTAVVLVAILALACINTTYSRDDEVEITDNLVHLILGQFAHHGDAFYQVEVKRTKALLTKDSSDFEARNDLGSAYTKLGMWEEAETEFLRNEETYPGRYKTHSNLGVMYKKMEDFPKAAKHITKALEIKPGGHMGLGDYYLRMIRWRGELKSSHPKTRTSPSENFLGLSYALTPEQQVSHDVVSREYLVTLIKNDYAFSDSYLVLGDVLMNEKNYQLAWRAYKRAEFLGHPAEGIVERRLGNVMNTWKTLRGSDEVVEPQWLQRKQFKKEWQGAALWLDDFQRVERELLTAGKPASFKAVKARMKELGIERPTIIQAGLYKGSLKESGGNGQMTGIVILLACGLIAGVILIVSIRAIRTKMTV